MKKGKRRRIWWWVLLLVAVAGCVYYLYSRTGPVPKEEVVTQKPPPVEKEALPPERVQITEKEKEPAVDLTAKEAQPTAGAEEDAYSKIEQDVADFFRYLDEKHYIKQMDLKMDTYTRFKKILKRLAAKPPLPAGEAKDPKIIVANIYHFFRVLKDDKKDLLFIREVISHERDSMEFTLEMFYKWFTLGERRPDPEGVRPSQDVMYRYAGFFLNTTGGRAYLFRRSGDIRLLITYYCLLIVHDADKQGKNAYGIDILPRIAQLKKEIARYPDLQLQSGYMDKLGQIENYYLKKRQGL